MSITYSPAIANCFGQKMEELGLQSLFSWRRHALFFAVLLYAFNQVELIREHRLNSLTGHKSENNYTDYKPNNGHMPIEYSSGYMHAANEL